MLQVYRRVPCDQNGTPLWTELRALVDDVAPDGFEELYLDMVLVAFEVSRAAWREVREDKEE